MDTVLRFLRWLAAAVVRSPGSWSVGASLALVWALLVPMIEIRLVTDVPGLVAETLWLAALGTIAVGLLWVCEAEPQLRVLATWRRLMVEVLALLAASVAVTGGIAVLLLVAAAPIEAGHVAALLAPVLLTLLHLVALALVLSRLRIPGWLAPALFLAFAWLVPALRIDPSVANALDASAHLDAVDSSAPFAPMNLLALAPVVGLLLISALLTSPYSRGN